MGDELPGPVKPLADAGYRVEKGDTGSVYFIYDGLRIIATVMVNETEPAPVHPGRRRTDRR